MSLNLFWNQSSRFYRKPIKVSHNLAVNKKYNNQLMPKVNCFHPFLYGMAFLVKCLFYLYINLHCIHKGKQIKR